MNDRAKAIRAVLREMNRRDAEKVIRSCALSEEEADCLVSVDLLGRSYTEVSMKNCCSPETVKRRRRAALRRMATELNI